MLQKKSGDSVETPRHIALYRKYRPVSFAEIVGQDHIVKVLEGSVETGRVSHAYLFAGSRGTGKTSTARIFAKALGTSENDIYEIDAASNRGIDDVRAIRDAVSVMPLESRYKVYIVDEAHMLTKEAFNALLKTLEEPPSHVIFMLATTEMDKLPDTVISRCQSFAFKKLTRDILTKAISSVAKKEGFIIEPDAANLVALLGDGSFRDALGVLDKVLGSQADKSDEKGKDQGRDLSAKSTKTISLEHIESLTGAPRKSLVNDFLKGLAAASQSDGQPDADGGGVATALTALAKADKAGIDMRIFLSLVLEKARCVLLLKSAAAAISGDISEHLSAEDFVMVSDMAKAPATITSKMLVELLHAYQEVGRAHIPSLPIELAVISISNTALTKQ